MWRSTAVLGLALGTATTPLFAADTEPGEPGVYAPWHGSRQAAPRPAEDRGPSPLPEEPELPRRAFELVPELGAALPHCGSRACGSLGAGSELALSALYRAQPSFAFGASARADAFGVGGADARARSLFAGVLGRVYFFESGLWDPYLELSLGVASLATEHGAGALRLRDTAAFAPTARVAAGLDFALNAWLRAGPTLGVVWHSARAAERCAGASCRAVDAAESALPKGATSFGLRLTFTAGPAQ